MLDQLKERFHDINTQRSEKLQILTVLPKSWSITRIQREFGVSNFTARKGKQLVKEEGILATPNPKPGQSLNEKTLHCVQSFYEGDDISRIMPGRKDFVSVRTNEGRQHFQNG